MGIPGLGCTTTCPSCLSVVSFDDSKLDRPFFCRKWLWHHTCSSCGEQFDEEYSEDKHNAGGSR
jgi:C4-type Zn-finger protein